jgi:hypothetical protein
VLVLVPFPHAPNHAQRDRPAHDQLVSSRPRHPERLPHQPPTRRPEPVHVQRLHRRPRAPPRQSPALHQPLGRPRGRLERGDRLPPRLGERRIEERPRRDPEPAQPRRQRVEKTLRRRPVPKSLGGDAVLVDVELALELRGRHPAPPPRRIHHLHPRPVRAPGDHEVRESRGQRHHHERGQRRRLGQQKFLHRQGDLLGLEAQHRGQGLHGVDGRAVHGGSDTPRAGGRSWRGCRSPRGGT